MPGELTAAQSAYLAAFERHLREVGGPLEGSSGRLSRDRLELVLAEAGVVPRRWRRVSVPVRPG